MGKYDIRPCPCGSGEGSWWAFDGRGIELCRVCSKCEKEQMKKYNPRILEYYTQADVDEPIEEEDY